MKPPNYIANFDSASAMLRATAASLKGAEFPALGIFPKMAAKPMKLLGRAINSMPRRAREEIYIWSGWNEAARQSQLSRASVERLCEWATHEYPQGQYNAAMIGSSNGANVHLCAALGIPWLPQTFLVPVKRTGPHPDEPEQDIEWGMGPARDLLENNPNTVLHHMHDPNQDRLMVQRMSYFRIKKQTLGPAYEKFLLSNLAPGATLYIVNCGLRWPTIRVQDRHYFQFGALGGARIDEFMHGGPRVRDYLSRYGSHRKEWSPPEPTGESPEAEWGFEPSLAESILDFANHHGFQVKTISFPEPEDLSPFVADFHQDWNRRRGVVGHRLLVESFIVMEPHWTIRTGSVPYWMFFNMEPSADRLEKFLSKRSFEEIYLMLFSHGVNSIGLASHERWEKILEKATLRGEFVGVDDTAYPADFASIARYRDALVQTIPSRYPIPPPLEAQDMEQFLTRNRRRYKVSIEEGFPWKVTTTANRGTGKKPKAKGNQGTV